MQFHGLPAVLHTKLRVAVIGIDISHIDFQHHRQT